MKKVILSLVITVLTIGSAWSQCVVSNCSTYVAQVIPYATFPTTGNSLVLGDDQMSSAIPIGFSFVFYCSSYTQGEVSSNGFFTFLLGTGNSACCSGIAVPGGAATPNNFIAMFWNDMYPPGNGTITYTTIGTAPNRQFIVSYNSIPYCCTTSAPYCTGQIVLYETSNNIELYTASVTGNGNNCTQGIEDLTGTIGVPVPGRNAVNWNATNSGYRFTTQVPTPPSAIIGNTTSCLGVQQSLSILPSPGATSYNWSFPNGWTGSSTTTAVTATVGATGAISVTATYSCGTSTPTTINYVTLPAPIVSVLSTSPALICSGQIAVVTATGGLTYTLNPGGFSGSPINVTPGTTTTYSLTGTDINGCQSINNATAMVYVNVSPTITVNSGSICLGQTFTMVPTGANNYSVSSALFIVTPTTSGIKNYTVVGTNTNGCVSSPVVSTLVVVALPTVLASSTKTDICRNESTDITASGANTYLWSNGANTALINVTPQSTQNYVVTGTAANGCVNTNNITIHVSQCVGLNENSQDINSFVTVFPNPSSGEFTLKTKTTTTIMIYDMQGKLIYNQKVNEGTQTVNLSQYASGEYLLKAFQGERKQSVVLIKQ